MASPATLQKFAEIDDLNKKKAAIIKQIGSLKEWKLTKNYVLVAVWVGSQFHQGIKIKLIRADLKEDIYQGRAGLLLKRGPTAFKEKDAKGNLVEEPEAPQVGEWVTFNAGEGSRSQINGVDIRYLVEDAIFGTTPNPDLITYRQS